MVGERGSRVKLAALLGLWLVLGRPEAKMPRPNIVHYSSIRLRPEDWDGAMS